MALEDLTGPNKYIANLVPANPPETDPAEQGCDHIQGIKNVLQNSFPGMAGAYQIASAQGAAANSMARRDFVEKLGIHGSGGTYRLNNFTLTAADAGKLQYVDASSSISAALPAISTLKEGDSFAFYVMNGNNALTINSAEGSNIIASGQSNVSFVTLRSGDSLTLQFTNGAWVSAASSGSNVRAFSANGNCRLPGGLLLQWGLATTDAGGNVTVTFPITFPNQLLNVQASLSSSIPQDDLTVTIVNPINSSFSIGTIRAGTGITANVYWFAIGF